MAKIDVTLGAKTPTRLLCGPFRVSVASFAPRLRIPNHFHEWACVSVLVEGRFEQRFPGRTVDCPPGVVLAKPPGERHEDRWFDAWSRHVIVEVDPERHAELGPARSVAEEIHSVSGADLSVVAHSLWREFQIADEVSPLAVEGLALQLVAAVHRHGASELAGPPRWLERAREYLHDNFRESFRVADVADAAGVHPDTLARHFSKALSVGVGQYVRRLRVQAAADLLSSSSTPIATVALMVGFSDQSHLTRVFKRETGTTPGRYRELHRGPTTQGDTADRS